MGQREAIFGFPLLLIYISKILFLYSYFYFLFLIPYKDRLWILFGFNLDCFWI